MGHFFSFFLENFSLGPMFALCTLSLYWDFFPLRPILAYFPSIGSFFFQKYSLRPIFALFPSIGPFFSILKFFSGFNVAFEVLDLEYSKDSLI